MSLLFCDSFDHYTSAADLALKWSTNPGGSPISAGNGRRGTASLRLTNAQLAGVEKNLASTYSTLIIGFNAKFGALVADAQFVTFMEGSTVHVALHIQNTGAIAIKRGSTVLATSGTGIVQENVDAYIELKATIHDSTGAYEIRVNGVNVLSATNQDTRNGGTTGLIDKIRMIFAASSGCNFDDLYLNDTSGSANNDFLGDCRVDCALVNAAGNYTQWTPSAGSNFQNVDDAAPDDDTTYNETDVDAEKDSYQHASFASLVVEDIKGLQVYAKAKKSDAGSRSLRVGVRSNTTDNLDTAVGLSTSYAARMRTFDTDPATSAAWSKSAIDAVESLLECGAP